METFDVIVFVAVIVLAELFKWVSARKGKEVGKTAVTAVALAVAFVLLWLQGGLDKLPVCEPGDVAACINTVIAWLAEVVGAAMIFYNLIIDKLFDKLASLLGSEYRG